MPNIMLRIIRPIENAAEKEYIKEFFRFIGCFISDCPVEDRIPSNWNACLIPENDVVDVVINYFGNDPYLQECRQKDIKRIYCYFDFHLNTGCVEINPRLQQAGCKEGKKNKKSARWEVLQALIDKIWEKDPETKDKVLDIKRVYTETAHGELFYFLQAKRCLRVLGMGEVLNEPRAQVTRIPLSNYIKMMISALWEVQLRLRDCKDVYGSYARINAASMIREIAFRLYDGDRPKIKSINYNNEALVFPMIESLTRDLQNVLDTDPKFVSAYLLMASLCKNAPSLTGNETICYQKMLKLVSTENKGYAFVWYRNAYFYEKELLDSQRALEYYQNAVRVNPDCYQALFKLGYYTAVDGRLNEAEAILKRMIQVIFCRRSTEPDENGVYQNWLALSLKDSQYVYKAYIMLAKISIGRNQENTAKSYIGKACMAATSFEEASLVHHVSDKDDDQFKNFMEYHKQSTPVWAMWQVLKPWSEDIIQDYFVRNVVNVHLSRWKRIE